MYFRVSLDFRWIFVGFVLDVHWMFFGFPLDFHLAFIESSTICIGCSMLAGCPLDFRSSIYSLDFLCIAYSHCVFVGFVLDAHWMFSGSPLNFHVVFIASAAISIGCLMLVGCPLDFRCSLNSRWIFFVFRIFVGCSLDSCWMFI